MMVDQWKRGNEQVRSKLNEDEAASNHAPKGTVIINGLIFTRAIVALDLIALTRLVMLLVWIIFLFIIVKTEFSRQMIALAIVSILACVTLARWLIGIAIGLIHGRTWADVLAGIVMLAFDTAVYNSFFIRSDQSKDFVGGISAGIYVNLSFLAYLLCRIMNREKV